MTIECKVRALDSEYANISVKQLYEGHADELFKPEIYLAIIKSLKTFDKDAFYTALSKFVTEDEMQSAADWIAGAMDDE